ncbi:hypothetical protein D3C86_1214750 [compost metagenome]
MLEDVWESGLDGDRRRQAGQPSSSLLFHPRHPSCAFAVRHDSWPRCVPCAWRKKGLELPSVSVRQCAWFRSVRSISDHQGIRRSQPKGGCALSTQPSTYFPTLHVSLETPGSLSLAELSPVPCYAAAACSASDCTYLVWGMSRGCRRGSLQPERELGKPRVFRIRCGVLPMGMGHRGGGILRSTYGSVLWKSSSQACGQSISY